jgi:transcriptional regulator GlxA family with amidase domain
MALAVVTVFETVNMLEQDPLYEVRFISERGGPVMTSAGMSLGSEPFSDEAFDTLIVGGGNLAQPSSPELIAFVRAAPERCRRVAAICTGAFVLAEAGLLDGRRATTHWHHARDLQNSFPKVKIDEDRIFINDGPIWTSAGMSAGIDLGLALIESDLGPEIARSVARKLVVYHRRAGGQSQFSALLELEPKSDRIQTALTYAKENLHKPLTVPDLAEAAHLSPRQFSRAFHAETGQSPAKAIENLRLEAARVMMEHSRHPIDIVARQTGFSDRDHMRRAFLRAFGQPPQVIRRNARLEAPN